MDLSRAVYSRDLKIAAMRALDAGARNGEIARKISSEPTPAGALAQRVARQRRSRLSGDRPAGRALPAVDDARRIAELERKIGQMTMENDFLKKALQHFKDHHPPAVVAGGDACLKKSAAPRRKAKP
jgi:transposase-like protein